MACVEYYGATKEESYLKKARKVYDMVYAIYLDPKNDPFQIFPKTYSSTRSLKAMSPDMILLNVSYIMRAHDKEFAQKYHENISFCISNIKNHYIPEYHCMLENVTLDNKPFLESSEARIINPGHDLECAFFLAQEADYRNDKELLLYNIIQIKLLKQVVGILVSVLCRQTLYTNYFYFFSYFQIPPLLNNFRVFLVICFYP
mgnify:CR=1 FL=1